MKLLSRLTENMASALRYGVMAGASVGTLKACLMAAEVDPVIAAIFGLLLTAVLCVHLTVDADDRTDRARATELRAVVAYALHLHEIADGGSVLFLKLHRSGSSRMAECFPGWPQFLAEFKRKAGDA